MAHALKLLDCEEHLFHLIRLGLAFVVLDAYPRIAGPRRLEDQVAGARLARLAEIFLADLSELGEPDICRLAP
jgi:hypothetical protein